MIKIPKKEVIDKIIKDKKVRTKLATESHQWFFILYLSHYITHPPASFHDEIFAITEDESIKNAAIVAFRGSGKSTLITLSYVIWSILGKQQKKFVLILGHTMYQAKIYMKNIKEELETNELLQADLGPFQEENEWQAFSLVIPNYNARITCASYEQGIRGLRHRQYRPDLIICDDVEDLESVKTLESRDKTYNWLTGEVIPAGDQNTKLIVVGNLLHEDSLIMRIKKNIADKTFNGIFRAYPFIDDNKNITWPGKFPTEKEINDERQKIGSESAWQREYMLRIIPDTERVIYPEWIHYYDTLPDIEDEKNDYRYTATGIDIAISTKETADYTAMVSARIYGIGENRKIYIFPNIINERLSFPETVTKIKEVSKGLGNGIPTKVFIEDVGYQKSIIQHLQEQGYPVEGVSVNGQDKRARLSLTTPYLQTKRIFFPKQGAKILIEQLLCFGSEKHDDLVDAFTILILKIMSYVEAGHITDEIAKAGNGETIFGNIMDMKF
ncbi:MAG: phage terminase large subunit [Candidatus Heimdallarchaeaceae archaeon]